MPISRISKAQETGQHICVDSWGPSFVEGTLALAAVILSAGAQYYAQSAGLGLSPDLLLSRT